MKQFCFTDIKTGLQDVRDSHNWYQVAQGNNHQQVATTEPGDLPDILHWDGCADRQVKKKTSDSIKSALQRSWSNSEENRYAGGRIYGPFRAFRWR